MAKLEKQSASPPPGQIKHDGQHIGTLQASSYKENGPGTGDDELYFGGGGNHPTNFNISTDSKTGVELGLKIHYRTGDDITPVSMDGGTADYKVPAGMQVVDPAHNVSSANPNRGAWNFDYSVNSGNQSLDAYDYRIIIKSGDVGEVHTYDRVRIDATHSSWVDQNGSTFGGDEAGLTNLTQNSVNMAFLPEFGADRFSAGETYDITLQAFDHGKIVAQVQDHLLLVA